MSKENLKEELPSKLVLPDGIILPEEFKDKEQEVRRSIRYPNEKLYDDFYKICHKAKVSLNKILVAYVQEFVKKNQFFLSK